MVNLLNSPEVALNSYSNWFLQKNINGSELSMSEDSDLEDIGVNSKLDRKYLLKQIAKWNDKGVDSSLFLPK